jgi:hypothetical protein
MDFNLTMETQTKDAYLKLLAAFSRLPEAKRSRTFMEISGYPHYEKVCSNILRFFFDPKGEHDLGDLLLVAFFGMVEDERPKIDDDEVRRIPEFSDAQVRTEVHTATGKFIDLVIEGEDFVIAIENKIFHWLANDLDDYGKHIGSLVSDKGETIRERVKTVLSLHPIKGTLDGGFISVTYRQLWHQVRQLLGEYITKADSKWVTFLLDFMTTTTNLAGQNMEFQESDQFFIEHHNEIEKLILERDRFLNRLSQNFSTLCEIMIEHEKPKGLSRKFWIYRKECLVMDFVFEAEFQVAMEVFLKPTGWELLIFGRGGQSANYLKRLLAKPALMEKIESNTGDGAKRLVKTWPIDADPASLKVELLSWVDALTASGMISEI